VLFQFSGPVRATSAVIQPVVLSYDTDVTYYTGTAASNLNLTGVSLSGLSGLGLTNRQDNDTNSSGRTVTLSGIQGNSLLFGARVGSDNDYFDISSLTVSSAQTSSGDQTVRLSRQRLA